jgi:hypothetical protein
MEKFHLRYQSTPPVLYLLHANPLAHDEWAAGGLCARYSASYVALNYFIPLWDKLGTGFWVRHAENISTSLVVFDDSSTVLADQMGMAALSHGKLMRVASSTSVIGGNFTCYPALNEELQCLVDTVEPHLVTLVLYNASHSWRLEAPVIVEQNVERAQQVVETLTQP